MLPSLLRHCAWGRVSGWVLGLSAGVHSTFAGGAASLGYKDLWLQAASYAALAVDYGCQGLGITSFRHQTTPPIIPDELHDWYIYMSIHVAYTRMMNGLESRPLLVNLS